MEREGALDVDALLRRLDPDQRAAVTAPSGPVVVVAGAGSGKTRVLTYRIAFRIATGDVAAPHVVAFTFTRQAAGELRQRLAALGAGRDVVAGTFHGVAYRILRRRWEDRGRREVPTLAANRLHLLTEALDGDRRLAASAVNEIDWARARLVAPGEYAAAGPSAGRRTAVPAERIAEIFSSYEAYKRKRRVLDFDDLLSECTAELGRPGVAGAVAWWHRHLHVDEFQDINPLQHAFLEALRNGGRDLFVVGDPAQAIYGWNGSDPRLLERVVASDLSPIVVHLPTNHRSSPEVVAAADSVLVSNRMAGGHVASRPASGSVELVAAADEADEARRVVDAITRLRPPGGSWRGLAVLARTHDLLRQLHDAFAAARIPTRIVTRGPSARESVLLREARRSSDRDDLHAWAVDLAWPTDTDNPDADLPGADPAGAGTVAADAARRALAAVREFERVGGGTGTSFAAWASLDDPTQDPGDASADAVDLVTMHAAKGREWSVVVVAGLDTIGLPAPTSVKSPTRAEEARLLYVAMTRATDHLVLSWSERRGGQRAGRSPLLGDVVPSRSAVGPPTAPPAWATARPAPPAIDPLRARLVEWRRRAAHAASVPPGFVMDDATLQRLVDARPADEEQLAAVEGIGPIAARRFGPRLLAVIAGDDQPARSTTTGA